MLFKTITKYWDKHADGYNKYTQSDLVGEIKNEWQSIFRAHFPQSPEKDLHVLDLGCGPGAFSILCADMGCQVTAIEGSPDMLKEARASSSAHHVAQQIKFIEGNVDTPLPFADHTFDVLVSRNVTWNLTQPENFYRECFRVLKKGGALLNFDGNWFLRFFDEAFQKGYLADRAALKERGWEDDNANDSDADRATLEQIARGLPLSKIKRPQWDRETLLRIGFSAVKTDEEISKRVWTARQQLCYRTTPMFLVYAVK